MAPLLQALDGVVGKPFRGEAIDILRPQISIGHSLPPPMIGGDQDAVPDRQRRLLRASAPQQAHILRAHIGPLYVSFPDSVTSIGLVRALWSGFQAHSLMKNSTPLRLFLKQLLPLETPCRVDLLPAGRRLCSKS
jgi:hypothetical protein